MRLFTSQAQTQDAVITPVTNAAKAGSAIPVRFSLGSDLGLNVFAPGSPTVQPLQCDTGAPIASVPETETVTAGASRLSYDPQSGVYTYVWKTDRAWASSCRELQLHFTDGETHRARFTFAR